MEHGFSRRQKGAVVYYTIPSFDKTDIVRHCVTTRLGGVSTGEAASLNLGFRRNDTRQNVLKNFELVGAAIGIDHNAAVLSYQVHGDTVRVVTAADIGKGITRESDIIGVDALVCAEAGVPIVTFYADCVPLLFLDPHTKTIALAHSGWRSTVRQIGVKTIKTMTRHFGCVPENILVGIGPSIGQCHFEVDADVARYFDSAFVRQKGKKYHVDLWGVIVSQLVGAGIKDENITLSGICTYCNCHEFYSHRADGGKTGSFAAFLQLV